MTKKRASTPQSLLSSDLGRRVFELLTLGDASLLLGALLMTAPYVSLESTLQGLPKHLAQAVRRILREQAKGYPPASKATGTSSSGEPGPPPRRDQLSREERLQAAAQWLTSFNGKKVVRAYEKRYGVDRASAVQELQRLGRVNPQDAKNMLDQLERSERRKRRSKSSEKADPRGVYGVDFDDHHAFIAGRTEAGFAFGVTWEDQERLDALEPNRSAANWCSTDR